MTFAIHDPDVLSNQVLRDTPPIGRLGFGVPIIIGAAAMSERVRSYSSPDAAQADADAGDISASLAAYVADAFAQTLKPTRVLVGRREPNVAQVTTFTIGGGSDGDYTITIDGTAYTHTEASGTATAADIAADLATLVDADDDVSAAAAGDDVVVTADTAGVPFTFSSSSTGDPITETETTDNVSVATELAALKSASSDWFGFALESRTDLDNRQAIEWAGSNNRLAALQTSTAAVKDGTAGNFALLLSAAQEKNGFIMYRADDTSTAAWKLLTNRLSVNLDRRTTIWSFVTLIGEVVDELTDTEKQNLISANVNFYLEFKSIPCTRPGVSPAGEKLDVLTTAIWTEARIDEALAEIVLDYVNRGDKIPYDDGGFKILEGEVNDVLQLGERGGHFQLGSTRAVFARFADLTDDDKKNRRVPYTYAGLLAGGVEAFEGTGYATTDEEFLDSLFEDDDA